VIESDHHPVVLKICLEKIIISREKAKAIRDKRNNARPGTIINWRLLHLDPEARDNFRTHLDGHLFPIDPRNADPTDFNDAITASAEATLEQPNDCQSDWFTDSEPILAPLRRAVRKHYDNSSAIPTDENKSAHRKARRAYKTAVQRAKDEAQCALAKQVRWSEVVKDSQKAWQTVRQIEKGSYAHHQPVTQNDMVLTDPETGQAVSDPASLLRIVSAYGTKLYNRDDAPTDSTILDDIDQRQYDWTLNDDPTVKELMLGAKGLANNKSPGQSGIPAEALKAFTKRQWQTILPMFVRFWHNDIPHDNFDEWKVAILKLLYKNKGDSKDLRNYCGIVLQDIFAQLMSAIIAKRLSKLLAQFGIEEQFSSQAGRGTADANWVLCHLLQTRKAHGIDSHVLFVDLIKTFDTANHELLFALLGKYGAPPLLVDAVC